MSDEPKTMRDIYREISPDKAPVPWQKRHEDRKKEVKRSRVNFEGVLVAADRAAMALERGGKAAARAARRLVKR